MSFEEYASASVQTSQDLGNIYTGINYLKYVDGEKHLVFVTDAGLFLPRLENDYSIAALASAARVVLDTLQTGGLITMNPFNRDPVTGVNRGVNTASLARVSTDQLSSGHDLNIAASAERAPGTANLLVHVTLRDDRITFEDADGRHKASVEVAYFAGTANQTVVGQDWQVVDLDLTDQNYEIFKTSGLSYTQTVPLTGNPAYVKVIAYDYAADVIGSALVRIPAK